MKKINYLLFFKSLWYFNGMSSKVIKSIESISHERYVNANQKVNISSTENICIIYSGKVNLYYEDQEKNEFTIRVLNSGDVFPLELFLHSKGQIVHSRAIENTTLLTLPVFFLESLIIENPEFMKSSVKLIQESILYYYQRM